MTERGYVSCHKAPYQEEKMMKKLSTAFLRVVVAGAWLVSVISPAFGQTSGSVLYVPKQGIDGVMIEFIGPSKSSRGGNTATTALKALIEQRFRVTRDGDIDFYPGKCLVTRTHKYAGFKVECFSATLWKTDVPWLVIGTLRTPEEVMIVVFLFEAQLLRNQTPVPVPSVPPVRRFPTPSFLT